MESPIENKVCTESLPVQKWPLENLYQWNGFWFRSAPLQGAQEVLKLFRPLPTDVILASYPKTGTTWLKSLLFSITNRSTSSPTRLPNHPHLLVPSLEHKLYGKNPQPFTDFPSLNNSKTRVFSTHIPCQILGETIKDCRVVYVTRNPKDTVVSMWHFVKKLTSEEEGEAKWPLEMAVDHFCNGSVPYGPYYDHVLGYREESSKNQDRVFFITYEELKDDPKTHVKRLAQFLGCPFDDELEVEEIVRSCSIETLKDQEVNKSSASTVSWRNVPANAFFREGKVGDHKKHLTGEMMEKIDKITRDKFHSAGFIYGV